MRIESDLEASARAHPEKPLLIYEGRRYSYSEIYERALTIAAGLYKIGIRKGDRVAFAIGNRPEFVTVYYGVLMCGAIAVPLNTLLKAAELRPYLTSVSPRAIVAHESVVNEVMSAGPHMAPVFVIGKHPTARDFEEVPHSGPKPDFEESGDDLAVLAYTSGTAGMPKAAMLSHSNLSANIDQMLEIPQARTQPDDVVLGVLPLFHIYGMNVVLGLSVRQGATVALEVAFEPNKTLHSIIENSVTVIVGAPPMYIAWLSLSHVPDLSRVRFAVSGASALPPDVIARFRERFGIEIWEGYGLTETAPVVATTRMAEQRPGSIGKVLPGQQVRIVDESGEDVVLGDPGELWVKGPNVFSGYWGDDLASSAAFEQGWFKTGDVGYQDEEGNLWLVDRRKELIIVSGFNVYPREIEEVLVSHPGVLDAAVMGVEDPRQGERVKAFVIAKAGQQPVEDELIVFCAKRLARFKVPSEIEFVAELPRAMTGKVMKRLLRAEELGPA